MKTQFELIIALVNTGFTELVMNAARKEGAKGGTVVHARGTANKSMEKRFGVVISPDKEIVLIIVDRTITDKVLSAIYKEAGLQTKGQGIAFTLPVDDVVGVAPNVEELIEEAKETKEPEEVKETNKEEK